MKVASPRCPESHAEVLMRVEMPQEEGGYWMWRCPECWHSERLGETERLDELFVRQEFAAILSGMAVLELAKWSKPVQMRVEHTDDPSIVSLEFREPA